MLLENDAGKASMLFQDAVNEGNNTETIQLGLCFLRGLGFDEDHGKAFCLFKEASESNLEGQ